VRKKFCTRDCACVRLRPPHIPHRQSRTSHCLLGCMWWVRIDVQAKKVDKSRILLMLSLFAFGRIARTGLSSAPDAEKKHHIHKFTQIDASCYLLDANAKCAVCWKTIYMDLDDKVLIACLCGFGARGKQRGFSPTAAACHSQSARVYCERIFLVLFRDILAHIRALCAWICARISRN